MKKLFILLMSCLILSGCTTDHTESSTLPGTAEQTNASTEVNFLLNIFAPDENAEGFNTIPTVITTQDAELVLQLLVEFSILEEDIQLNSARLDGKQLNLDFNQAFLDQLCTYGTAGERMMIGCVVNTYLSIYDAETVFITVNGEIIESGHVIYDFPMEFFE